jgi:hypothetical protein
MDSVKADWTADHVVGTVPSSVPCSRGGGGLDVDRRFVHLDRLGGVKGVGCLFAMCLTLGLLDLVGSSNGILLH